MKSFQTGFVALVEDCQIFLNFLHARFQIDVKAVKFKFLQKFKASEKEYAIFFEYEADRQLRKFCTVKTEPAINRPTTTTAALPQRLIRYGMMRYIYGKCTQKLTIWPT